MVELISFHHHHVIIATDNDITIDISAYPTDEGGESDVSCKQYMGDEGCC